MNKKVSKDDLVSYVISPYTKKKYHISTKYIKKSCWISSVCESKFFGLFPDFHHPLFSFIRYKKEDAYKVHEELKTVITNSPRNTWFGRFPKPTPPEGWGEDAKALFEEYGLPKTIFGKDIY